MRLLFQQIGLGRNRFSYGQSIRRLFYFIVKKCKQVKLNSSNRKGQSVPAYGDRGTRNGEIAVSIASVVFDTFP